MAKLTDDDPPGLRAVREALTRGDLSGVRIALLSLDDCGRQRLEARLGPATMADLFARARRRRRGGAKRGRVLVLAGIPGSELHTVDTGGDDDLVWVHYLRLIFGAFGRFELTLDGTPADPRYRVHAPSLLLEYYLPLIMKLDEQWDVRPVPYDWRLDIDVSTERLARQIQEWTAGRPAHVVAHSMGGLVARRLTQRFPDVWRSMQDPDGGSRGGRLVMLGTPNQGSLEAPAILSGEQQMVRILELADLAHDMDALLGIVGTFAGIYQLLPSPKIGVGDDRARLFDRKTWGRFPVHQKLLDSGRTFQEALATVTDPERLLYVAGCDQETPYRIRVDGPGRFRYQTTLDGDGRVPHELGLLKGVRTFWVEEEHGNLPRNERVLAGIDDLLATGDTQALERERPSRRGTAEPSAVWRKAAEIEAIPAEAEALVAKVRGTRARPKVALTPAEGARLEALLLRPFLGGPPAGTRGAAGPLAGAGLRDARRAVPAPRFDVEVVWGDITRVRGDVYAVGHYQGVLPQFAELALDRVISGKGAADEDLLLTSLTRRGVLRGQLGDVYFYPWPGKDGRMVAVAGMGHPGSFGRSELRLLARNLAWAIGSLRGIQTVCTVLIGSGAGNLGIMAALEGLIAGLGDSLEQLVGRNGIARVRVVERRLSKAQRVHEALRRLAQSEAVRKRIDLRVPRVLRRGPGGEVDVGHGLALVLAAAATATKAPDRSARRRAVNTLLGALAARHPVRRGAERALESLVEGARREIQDTASRLEVSVRAGDPGAESDEASSLTARGRAMPSRLSFVTEGPRIRAAAITDTAVVPEREIGVDPKLVDEVVTSMSDPEPEQLSALSTLLARLLVPRDFRETIATDQPVVFEVDRAMARVHWEMLSCSTDPQRTEHLALRSAFARQLRTGYSPAPAPAERPAPRLRALVIGDPGDPNAGEDLPGARREALEVITLLEKKDVEVVGLVGAPSAARDAALGKVRPASRLAVLDQLLQGGFDILHYAGHGDFDPDNPSVTGWLFEGGLLTASELERVDVAPRLVVANACLSARTSEALARGRRVGEARTEADLLPGLADEFFRRGVRNYIGTAWEVSDVGAILFATHFYDKLIPGPGLARVTLGEAVLGARRVLAEKEGFGALWAAYQHYGDPTLRITGSDARAAGGKASARRKPTARGRRSGRRSR